MKKKKALICTAAAWCAMCAASVFGAATTAMTQPFATDGSITTYSNWGGYGTVADESGSYSQNATVGLPIAGVNGAFGKSLTVEGWVTNAVTTAGTSATVDMMVQIALPDDGLEIPSSETPGDIQIAVGVETNAAAPTADGDLKVYCKGAGGTVGWYSLGKTFALGTWVRVSFTFDYNTANDYRCRILVDGDAASSENGYVTSTGSTTGGAWYKLANNTVAALSSVKVIGSTKIDEVLVKYSNTASDVMPTVAADMDATVASTAVTKSWLVEQGLPESAASGSAPDGSGMTVEQKYLTGVSVTSGEKFEFKTMAMKTEGGTVKATLTFPVATAPAGYKNVIRYSTSANFTSSTTVDAEADGEQTISLPENTTILYYRLETETTSN